MRPALSICITKFPSCSLFYFLSSVLYAQEDSAPVPSVCDPLMPLEVYDAFHKFYDFCICVADSDYDTRTEKANEEGDADGIVMRGPAVPRL